jgi:hypothetical protein
VTASSILPYFPENQTIEINRGNARGRRILAGSMVGVLGLTLPFETPAAEHVRHCARLEMPTEISAVLMAVPFHEINALVMA